MLAPPSIPLPGLLEAAYSTPNSATPLFPRPLASCPPFYFHHARPTHLGFLAVLVTSSAPAGPSPSLTAVLATATAAAAIAVVDAIVVVIVVVATPVQVQVLLNRCLDKLYTFLWCVGTAAAVGA